MASVGVRQCFQVWINEIDFLIESIRKNFDFVWNHFVSTFSILVTMILGWNTTILPLYPSSFSTLCVILSSIDTIYVWLNLNFDQLQGDTKNQTKFLMIPQFTVLFHSITLIIDYNYSIDTISLY